MTEAQRALRESAAVSLRDHVLAVRVDGDGSFDALDRLIAGDLYVRTGRMRHTLLLADDATPFADVYVCADDDGFLLLAEGPGPEELLAHLQRHAGAGARIRPLWEEAAIVGIDGPYAWELAAEVLGPDLLGLPYLTFCPSADGEATCFRSGKTGEYGFDVLVPRSRAGALFARLLETGRRFDAVACGLGDLDLCALENWFFNPRREGRAGVTPLELQLQWRVSRRKPYVGAETLAARRAAGIRERLVCLVGPREVRAGDALRFEGRTVGRIVNTARSPHRGDHVASGLVEVALAHSGLEGFEALGADAPAPLRIASPPVLDNRSLYVHPQRHAYATRGDVAWPSIA